MSATNESSRHCEFKTDRSRWRACAAALAAAAGAALAATTLGGCQPAPPPEVPPPAVGLRYYAPKQVVIVDADVTELLDRHVTGELTIDSKLRFKGTQATVSLRTLPDIAKSYTLDISPGPSGQDRLTGDLESVVGVGSDALLVSANSGAAADDPLSRQQLLTDVTHFPPAAAIGAAPDAHGGDVNDLANPIDTVFNMTESGRRLRGPEHESALAKFRQLPPPLLYFLQESQEGRELWDRAINLDGLLAAHLVERDDLYDRVTSASAGVAHGQVRAEQAQQELQVNKTKLEAMSTEIESLRNQRDGVDAALQADLERLLSSRQIGPTDHTTHYVATLALSDLPPPNLLANCVTDKDVEEALEKYPKALDSFRQTRVVVTLDGLPAPAVPAVNPNSSPGGNSANAQAAPARRSRLERADQPRPPLATIEYRQALAAEVGVWAMAVAPDAQNSQMEQRLTRVDQQSVAVLDPREPVTAYTFDPEALASRRIVLGFDAEDRFTGPTAAVSPALAEARRNEQAQRQARSEAQRRLARTTEMDQLEQQLHTLRRRADLLDCTIAMQSETVENAVLTQRSRLQDQIAQLQSRLESMWTEIPGQNTAQNSPENSAQGSVQIPTDMAVHASTSQSPGPATPPAGKTSASRPAATTLPTASNGGPPIVRP